MRRRGLRVTKSVTYNEGMKQILLLLFLALVTSLAVSVEPTTTPKPPKTREAVEKLRSIEREIRSRQHEADEEVRKAREEADRLTKQAEAEAKRIREEADAYTKKTEKEIEEIRKRDPARAAAALAKPKAPTRKEIAEALASLTDPMLACWQPVVPSGTPPASADVESCVVNRLQQRLKPWIGN